jgi:hypothetical protein
MGCSVNFIYWIWRKRNLNFDLWCFVMNLKLKFFYFSMWMGESCMKLQPLMVYWLFMLKLSQTDVHIMCKIVHWVKVYCGLWTWWRGSIISNCQLLYSIKVMRCWLTKMWRSNCYVSEMNHLIFELLCVRNTGTCWIMRANQKYTG